jgi:hypothetical protein
MKETLKKNSDSAEQQTTHRYHENKNFYPNHDRRGLKAGIGIVAAGAVLIAGGFAVNKFAKAEAEPTPETTTEDVIDHDPTAGDPTDLTSQAPEELTLESFPFIVDGEEYVGVDAFEQAFAVPATPATEYPGVYNSEERDAAIQADVNTAINQVFDRVNLLLSYDFTDSQREEYSEYQIDYAGEPYIGTDALRMQFVREALSQALVGETDMDGDSPSPDEFINQLAELSVYADWEEPNDGTPYEISIQPVAGTDEIGGTELAGGAIVASGTVQVEVVTNRRDGDGTTFDLTGFREIDVVHSTEPVTWKVFLVNETNEDGTASWRLTSADTLGENGNSLL